MIRKFKAARLFAIAMVAVSPPYFGPCDLVTCSEAWSVTRAMKASYTGPLMQITNDTGLTTLNIVQDTNHKADMSTWSAFCRGVASNCKVTKIYAQINSANDLVPLTGASTSPTFPSEPTCNVTPLQCATPFKIEAATGLPRINLVDGQEYVIGGSDQPVTGINTNGAAVSVAMNFQVQMPSSQCCGQFGLGHLTNANTAGTDFSLMQGNPTISALTHCPTPSVPCIASDLESLTGQILASLSGISAGNQGFELMTYNSGTTTLRMNYNGSAAGSSVLSGLIQGDRLHFGGGGDRTQPAPIIWREGFFSNSDINASAAALFANQQAFYSALTFAVPSSVAFTTFP